MGRGSKPAELIGTQSADRIRASGHARRVEQAGHRSAPDRADLSERNPLRGGGRSLIAAPPSRLSFTSPARVTVLSAVSTSCRNFWSGREAPALQGPQRAYA